ncbi:hypothetical protein EUX98_g4261 [Antrodiella citrinella]|uniref:J domain-containing protein n=1 Tax=Antrodiella citrinella TaxID=2447956 RepID=A0A4S4MUE5_9APHY|nr:hypothetical protein EUX98_g4261 [Antrodiella citrinella]
MPVPTPSKKSLYKVLDLEDDASEDAIRVAYKKLALKWHPDRNQDDKEAAQEKFIEISDAYNALLESRKHSRLPKRSSTKTTPPPKAASTSSSHSASSSTPTSSSTASSSKSTTSTEGRTSNSKSSHPSEAKSDAMHKSSSDKKDNEAKSSSRSSHSTSSPESKHSSRSKPARPATPFAHLDSDSSSDEEDNDHCSGHKTHKDSFGSGPSTRKKFRPLEEDGYEFIDFGSPLQPIRAPSVKSSSTKSGTSKSGDLSKDWIFPLQLSLDDLYHGASHHYRVIRTLRSGKTQTVKIDIKVLPGWQKGTRIRVPAVGNERKDGTFQDIVFVVEEQPHTQFSRVDNDLYVTVQVPWAETRSRPYSWSSMDSRLDGDPSLGEELAFVKGMNGAEYGLPIPASLVEGADGTRVVGAGMPIREKGEVVGKGDLVIKWDFIFPETEKAQQSRWQSLKKRAMHWKH